MRKITLGIVDDQSLFAVGEIDTASRRKDVDALGKRFYNILVIGFCLSCDRADRLKFRNRIAV